MYKFKYICTVHKTGYYLNTGDSGTMRERPRAARGTRGQRAASCHQRQWRPRLIISTEPTHLQQISVLEVLYIELNDFIHSQWYRSLLDMDFCESVILMLFY